MTYIHACAYNYRASEGRGRTTRRPQTSREDAAAVDKTKGLKDFYPTPENVIVRMLEGFEFGEAEEFLDLGAGTGDISEYIEKVIERRRYHSGRGGIDVVEINPELQHVLRGKGFRLVHDDIRTFETNKVYDLIVGNFPFSIGAECLAKALSILERNGGHLRCIVNAETLKNPYTNLRKAVRRRLEDLGAEIEFLPGEFVKGERPAGVEAALIKLHVERPDAPSIILDSLERAREVEVREEQARQIVSHDYMSALVARYNLECRLGVKIIDEYFALAPHLADRFRRNDEENDYSKPLIELKVEGAYKTKGSYVNHYLRGLRHKYWSLLMDDPRFNGLYTSNILNELKSKLTELKEYEFTLFNIGALIEEMNGKIVEGIEASILALFDKLTARFAYDESIQNGNVWFYSGWKTNKAWKVNRRVILPMYLLESGFSGLKFNYRAPDEIRDMVKVFNYLNEAPDNVRLLVTNACASAERREDFRGIDLRYFEISCFKKGTVHLTFTNQRLLDKFNIFAGQRKKWLPPAYGKKPYEELDAEERAVVDEFQGREAYAEVVKESQFYIVETADLLRLATGAGGGEGGATTQGAPLMLAPAGGEAQGEQAEPEEQAGAVEPVWTGAGEARQFGPQLGLFGEEAEAA